MLSITSDQKNQWLAVIRRAKSSHIRWRAYAQGLVSGVDVDNDKLPVQHTDCGFGRWYFSEGTKDFGHLEIFRNIQGPHEMLHGVYAQIHDLVQKRRLDEARGKLENLIGISRTLLEQMELLEKEVEAIAA